MKTLLILGTLTLSLVFAQANCGTCSTGDETSGEDHSADLLNNYFSVQKALASDNLDDAKAGADALLKSYAKTGCAEQDAECCLGIHDAAHDLSEAGNILKARVAFKDLSDQFITMLKNHGNVGADIYLAHCPMAMNGGADWLQNNDDLVNPYYGSDMLKCGTIKKGVGGKAADHGHKGHDH